MRDPSLHLIKRKFLPFLIFLITVTTASAQFGPCAANNNTPPPAGPPLPAANTMTIDVSTLMPMTDFCLGNMMPPEPQTIGGCGTFTLTNLPVGIPPCNPEICFTPQQGCGNAIGNVCVWVENPPGTWQSLGAPNSADGSVCMIILPGTTQISITICRPGMGPIGLMDVNVIACCDADAGTVTVSPSLVCPGGTIDANTTGNQTDPLYTQVFLLDLNNNGTIDGINATGIFNIPAGTTCGSTHSVCSYNYLTSGTAPANPTNISAIDCVANCCDLNCTTFTVNDLVPPVITCVAQTTPINCPAAPVFTPPTATDACDAFPAITFIDSFVPGACAGTGTHTRTWTATDACGNTATCARSIVVQDVTPPVITCVTQTTPINCPAAPVFTPPTATDGCSTVPPIITFVDAFAPGACAGTGTHTRTWTATDACGNTATCARSIVVQDVTGPAITCPANATVACNAPTTPAATGTATATDVCSTVPPVVIFTDVSTQGQGCSQFSYIIIRTWRATDACGNTSTCSQTITVQDLVAPTIACPANVTRQCDQPTDPGSTGNATATGDNCAAIGQIAVTFTDASTQTAAGCTNDSYIITRTWRATDPCGNTATCVQTITVVDTTPPTIICPANVTIQCDVSTAPGVTGIATGNAVANSVSWPDASSGLVGTAIANVAGIPAGATILDVNVVIRMDHSWVGDLNMTLISPSGATVNFMDNPCASGNSDNINATFDSQGAGFLCTTGVIADVGDPNGCSNDYLIGSAINGVIQTQLGSFNTFNNSTMGNGNWQLQITDEAGGDGGCLIAFSVQVTWLTMTGGAVGAATAVDNCSPLANITFSNTDVTTQTATGCGNDNYVITRTWRATDACGNFSTCLQTINVVDTTPPVITCPASVSIACTASTAPGATGTATATDNCSATVTITSSDVTTQTAGGCSNDSYQIFRTWRATDACGNSSTCLQTITVSDTQAPVITCPPGQTLTCFQTVPAPFTTAAAFIAGGGTITDNCTTNLADFTVFVQNVDNGNDNCPGNARVVTRTYFVQDACGNTTSCVQTFTYLASTQGPVITSVLPTCFKFCASLANPMETDITYTTDCSFGAVVNITGPTQIGATNCPGTIYRYTYTVTDDCGRTSAPVTRDFIIGNDGPEITCPPFNLILECGDPNNQDYIDTHLGLIEVNTSCELGYTLTHTPQNFNLITCGSSTIVTFTATDACGRTATCSTTIAIQDFTAPTIVSVPPPFCNVIECGADANFWFNHWVNYVKNGIVAVDDCDDDVTFTHVGTLNQTCNANGVAVSTVTFRATDNCNNTSTYVGTFTIQNTAPALFQNVPANATIECNGPIVFGPAPTVIEQCQTTVTVTTTVDSSDPCSVEHTRTWTATDACGGLTTSVSQTITVVDNEAPVAPSAPANVTVQCATNVPAPVNLTATDNCGGNITVSPTAVTTPGSCVNRFTMVRTWTFTDACGNSSSVSQTITVNDITAPVAPAAPANVTVQCSTNVPAPVNLTATDNCSGNISVSPTSVTTSGNCANNFTVVRTWTFTDACGNSSSVSQTITVNDSTAPVAPAAPANVTVQCAANVPAPVNLTASDNCDGNITVAPTAVITPGTCADRFTMVRTWTFADGCGNSATISQTITVNDNTAPTFTFVPAGFSTRCINNGNATAYAQICASSDDAEEDCDTGEMDLLSTDLEMSQDESQDKSVEVGVRFKDLHIPAGATITGAYIQFTVDATIGYDPSELTIKGQDSDNAATFTLADDNISDRPRTSASAEWEPGDWEVIGDNKAPQRTPNLAAIVQEIVNRGGYTSESALAFFIKGIGKRTAISWDGNPGQAPELFVTYTASANFGTPTATDNCSNATITFVDTQVAGCDGSKTRTWTATDACGNTATASQTIDYIGDNVPPVFTFVPDHVNTSCEDTSYPPTFGTPTAVDNCGGLVTITFIDYFDTGDANSCDEDDEDWDYRRRWTATDACGNTTTAEQRYNVKDSYALSGKVYTETNNMVEDVQVTLEGFGLSIVSQTEADGTYAFDNVEANQNYNITPALNANALNGVTSYDMVLISKHILLTETLDSPYKMIAADINRSGSITTLDLAELRKLILHIDESFTNNTSWRFVEADFIFPVYNNPFATVFPEEVFINGLLADELHDFIGVKIGDVNGSAITNGLMGAEDRSFVGDLVFQVEDQQLKAGQSYAVDFYADNFQAMHGYQFTLNFDPSAVTFESVNAGNLTKMSENNFGLTLLNQGVITTSWTNEQAQSVGRDSRVFTVTFTAQTDAKLSEVLSIGSRYTKAEAYNVDLDLMDVTLRFGKSSAIADGYQLYQNTPNPFMQETVIGFDLPEAMNATLTIYDGSGRLLKQIEGDFAKGYNAVSLSRGDLSPGSLQYQLVTPMGTMTKKMILQ